MNRLRVNKSKRKIIFTSFLREKETYSRMSEPENGIHAFMRVTRRRTCQKAELLDNDNSYIVSISTKSEKKALVSKKAPELHESSPKIKKVRNQFYKESLSRIT